MSEEEEFTTFELSPEDFPFTVQVFDKDEVQVDEIVVEGPGVFQVDKYPVEGRPYSVRVIRAESQDQAILRIVESSVGFTRWTGI